MSKSPRCVCPLSLSSHAALSLSHQELSEKAPQALLEILLTGLTLGSLPTPLYLPKPWNHLYLLCLPWNSRSQTWSSSPLWHYITHTLPYPPVEWNPLPNPSSHVLTPNQLPCSPTESPGTPRGRGRWCLWVTIQGARTRLISLHTRGRSITPERQSQKGFRQLRQIYCSTPSLSYPHIQDIFRELSEFL